MYGKSKKDITINYYLILFFFSFCQFLPKIVYSQLALEEPEFSHTAGFYESGFDLIISHHRDDVTIHYTLDGSEPTDASPVYKNPLRIEDRSDEPNDLSTIPTTNITDRQRFRLPKDHIPKGTVVRVKVFKEGFDPVTKTGSYFVFPEGKQKHENFSVISIATDKGNFFSDDTGIYVPGRNYREGRHHTGNYYERGISWERESFFEFFDEEGELQVSQIVGVRIHGGITRRYAQKSLRIYARSDYGESHIDYRVFPDKRDDSYKRLILRASGNDQGESMFKDAFAQSLVSHLSFDTQASRPAVVYINGEYWGIHNIRERYDRHYLDRVYGIDPGNIDLLTELNTVTEGDDQNYREVTDFVEKEDLSNDDNMAVAEEMIDLDNFLDYFTSQIYFANYDWPHKNIDFWRLRTNFNPNAEYGHDGRWRWMMYDVDYALYNYRGDTHRDSMLEFVTGSTGAGGNRWSNLLLHNLLDNEQFKHNFINRIADLLNTAFRTEYVLSKLVEMAQIYESEMPQYINRWNRPDNMSQWNSSYVFRMQNFVEKRPEYLYQNVLNHFNLSSTLDLTVESSHGIQGAVKVNSILITPETPGISENPYPWTGTYFSGIPVILTAPSHPRIQFRHWEINQNKFYDSTIEVLPDTIESAKAVYSETQLSDINPYPVSGNPYFFYKWDENEEGGTYPESIAFVYMNETDPGLDARPSGLAHGAYNLNSRTRINGLGEDGFSFLNAGNPEGNPGYPGTRLGGAILALDTRDINRAEVGFEAGTVLPNSRVYYLRLQYRIGNEGTFTDLTDTEGNPVEYKRNEEGHSEFIGPVAFPEEIIGHPRVELLWKYYYTGEQTDEQSGQRAQLNISSIHVAEIENPPLPEPYSLAAGTYKFTNWPSDTTAGAAPESMRFAYMSETDPGPEAFVLGYTSGAYNLESRTRVNGLGETGFAFINTSNADGNPGYPGGRLGGAVLALNTEDRGSISVEWTAGTVRPNSRVYHLRLQYRTSTDEPFRDVLDNDGNPVEYRRNQESGHSQVIGPVMLPSDAEDQPYVQLFWRYYFTGERTDEESGQRSMLNISQIGISSYALMGSSPGEPLSFRLYQNYPNPFFPSTTIRFDLSEAQHVRIDLYTITGRHVAVLEDRNLDAGRHATEVDASGLASGIYLYRLKSNSFTKTGKMSVIK